MAKQVIHYDTGNHYSMPISGAHIETACTKWFQQNYKPDQKRYTKDKEVVTCKNCLNRIKNKIGE